MKQGILIAVMVATANFSCRNNGTEPPTSDFQLIAEDVGVTEVWLRVKATERLEPRTLTLSRDGQTILTIESPPFDTLVLSDRLSPKHSYNYRATLTGKNFLLIYTAQLTVTTMDTTSHDFTWEIHTLGDGASSVLNDVAIINDTLAYFVGEINVQDSLGWQNPPYNLAKWNGQRWEFMTLKYNCRLYHSTCGPETLLYSPAGAIFAFGANDVWISAGSVHHFDGVQWTEEAGIQGAGGAYSIWGSASNDLWFVGYGGFIAHRTATTWLKIESTTTLPIQDIWGAPRNTDKVEILAVAGDPYSSHDRKILSISGTEVLAQSDSGISLALSGIWFAPGNTYWTVGDGMYYKKSSPDGMSRWAGGPNIFTTRYTFAVRGNDINDVVAVGGQGEIIHFNGMTWKSYYDVTKLGYGNYYSVAIKGSIIVAVGQESPRAVVAIGKRRLATNMKGG